MILFLANDSIAHLYIQKDPIIIRNQQRKRFKRMSFMKHAQPDRKLEHGETTFEDEGCTSQHQMERSVEKNTENVADEQKDERAMEDDYNKLKVRLESSEEKLKISENLYKRHEIESGEKMKEFEEQMKCLQNKINDLEDQNKRLKEENVEKIGEKVSKISEQNKIIEDLNKANNFGTNKIQHLNSLLMEEKEKNEKFTTPICSQV